jgi:hypothetical protein
MKIDAPDYERMKSWLAHLVPRTYPAGLLTAQTDPVVCLGQIEARSPRKAREGLAMAIGDTIEMTDGWTGEQVAEMDGLLARDGLPTLSEMRARFSKVIRRVLDRGGIRNQVEYHAVRNAAELAHDGGGDLWALLSAYETRHEG